MLFQTKAIASLYIILLNLTNRTSSFVKKKRAFNALPVSTNGDTFKHAIR